MVPPAQRARPPSVAQLARLHGPVKTSDDAIHLRVASKNHSEFLVILQNCCGAELFREVVREQEPRSD